MEYNLHSREGFLVEKPSVFYTQKSKGEILMEEQTACLVERIGGVTFIVNVKPAENAKQTADELIKALIAKECLALEAECA